MISRSLLLVVLFVLVSTGPATARSISSTTTTSNTITTAAISSSRPVKNTRRKRPTLTQETEPTNDETTKLFQQFRGGASTSTATAAPATRKRKREPRLTSQLIRRQNSSSTSSKNGNTHTVLSPALLQRLKIGGYFALWYILNVFYNIQNKLTLNKLPQPMMVGSFQLGIGSLYCSLLWLLQWRAKPVIQSPQLVQQLRQVGLWHAIGQLCTMLSLGAGPVSFTHIVKALEPFFSAVVSALLLGQWMPLPVYLTLLPVVGGVGYACLKERSFSWLAFGMAMSSNLAFALRAVLSKRAMNLSSQAVNMTPPNVFGLVTIASFFLSLPLALLGEGRTFLSCWKQADVSSWYLVQAIVVSGLFHYLNNEVMYLALGSVHPITLAVGNTMKRVFIMVASVMVFRNPISLQAGVGSAIGIAGVLLYSLTKQYYEK